MQEELAELKRKVSELEEWKRQRETRQISQPLDSESLKTLNEHFLSVVDEYIYFGGAGDNSFLNYVAVQGDKRVDLSPGLVRYTVNPSTDYLSIVDKIITNKFADDATLTLYTTDTPPAGLSAQGLTTYHVISAATDGFSFKVSLTQGGAAVDITDSGTGRQLLQRL